MYMYMARMMCEQKTSELVYKMAPSHITDQPIYSEEEALDHARIPKVLPEGSSIFAVVLVFF